MKYVDSNDKVVRSYEDPNLVIKREGEPVLIGNGSEVELTLCVYPTAMTTGNRFESLKIKNLVEYEAPSDEPGDVGTEPSELW